MAATISGVGGEVGGNARPQFKLRPVEDARPGMGTALKSAGAGHTILEAALAAAMTLDPDGALDDRLASDQAAEQRKFAALPVTLREDPLVQLRHERALRHNQAVHDGARKILRLARVWGRAPSRA